MKFPEEKRRHIQDQLLEWYHQHSRDLPWRVDTEPYRVAVSEFMLQQTQVKTVIPYFNRFMQRFPDWRALHEADEEDVLKAWEGLGYYRRARLLKQLASAIVVDLKGEIPNSREALLKLPGLGPYTAAAIASIAFQQAVGVVDGNVYRVMSRVFDLDWDISLSTSKRSFQTLADQWVSPSQPGDFNQAAMELGATVCSPTKPDCARCPICDLCEIRVNGLEPETRPVKSKRTKVRREIIHWAWLEHEKRLLLIRRPASGLMANFWELPTLQGIEIKNLTKVDGPQFDYKYSHIHATYKLVRLEAEASHLFPNASTWLSAKQINELSLTGAARKAIKLMDF